MKSRRFNRKEKKENTKNGNKTFYFRSKSNYQQGSRGKREWISDLKKKKKQSA